jgi:hypothetical protein
MLLLASSGISFKMLTIRHPVLGFQSFQMLQTPKTKTHHEGRKNMKNEFKTVNHKGHKELIGREARKINFL